MGETKRGPTVHSRVRPVSRLHGPGPGPGVDDRVRCLVSVVRRRKDDFLANERTSFSLPVLPYKMDWWSGVAKKCL